LSCGALAESALPSSAVGDKMLIIGPIAMEPSILTGAAVPSVNEIYAFDLQTGEIRWNEKAGLRTG
jgi:outer membrane protein assembly factor BamB